MKKTVRHERVELNNMSRAQLEAIAAPLFPPSPFYEVEELVADFTLSNLINEIMGRQPRDPNEHLTGWAAQIAGIIR